jgi:hypothetical protein
MKHTLIALALAIVGFTTSVAVAFVLYLSLAAPASAEPAIQVFGVGIRSCSLWLHHTTNTDLIHIEMGSWMDGYLSARNEAIAGTGKSGVLGSNTDNDARDAWVTKYCQAHPRDFLYAAAKALADELKKTGQ